MILHLLGLILIPHLLQAFSSSFVDICSFSKTRSITVVSSAYRMLLMRMSPIWIPLSKFWRSFITNSRNRLKRLGDRRHPCLTPVTTLNHSVIFPLTLTEHSVCLYILSIRSTITLSTPMERRHFHKASLQMVSNDALKSTKFQ